MKQNLRRILLCAALAGLPFIHVKSYDWVPVGDAVDANGFATTGGSYLNYDYIADDAPQPQPRNRSFTATFGDSTLNVYGTLHNGNPSLGGFQVGGNCPLKVNGNVVLDATNQDMTININENVVFEPYFDPPAGGEFAPRPVAECSQLYFKTDLDRTITINVLNNLEFRGKTVDSNFKDLIVTFAGRGTTVFNMSDGTTIKFNGQVDTSSPQVALDPLTGLFSPCPQPSVNAGGTKVFVLMDQTQSDVEAGNNKVLFKRSNIFNSTQRVLIEVGPNSVFTYLSTNPTGLPSEFFNDGYGAVAFDPSNYSSGRMVLFIHGAYLIDNDEFFPSETELAIPNPNYKKIIEKYLFNDGAVLINGHLVGGFDPESITGCAVPAETEGTFPGYDFSVPAGIKAIWRVIDNGFFFEQGDNVDVDNRRGLLVVNENMTHSKGFSDPYWDLYTDPAEGYTGVEWAQSNPVNALLNTRRGFVLGVNGCMDIYHNTFIDHVAGTTNVCDSFAECDFADPEFGGTEGILKPRNPSALMVDGLDPALFISGNPFVPDINGFPLPSLFEAADPFTQSNPSHAQVWLRGTGALYVRASGTTDCDYLSQFWSFDPDPLGNTFLDWTNALALGQGTYDGYRLSPNANTNQSGEGQHVLDVEGSVEVRSVANTTAHYYSQFFDNSGVVNMPSVLIDHTGREVLSGDYDYINRPLLNDGTAYTRYNSPTMFFNNFASFFNTIIVHNDASKYVDGIPHYSEPAMTGGERLWFGRNFWDVVSDSDDNRANDPNRYRFPEIQLFNSTLELQESCNISGLRFVVKDIPDVFLGQDAGTEVDSSGNNLSVIKFFDHGDPLDTGLTGHGRVFLVGSGLNQMCDGSNNCVTDSAFVNVFKHNLPVNHLNLDDFSLNNSSWAKLSLQNGDQFHPEVQAMIDEVPSFKEKQRAHHLFMLAQPQPFGVITPLTEPECQANVTMSIGWSNNTVIDDLLAGNNSPAGDARPFPGSFPYSNEPLITNSAVFLNDADKQFTLDALRVPASVLSIDGSFICFGSFDRDGNSIKVPVLSDNDNGVVFVKHGGRITVTRPEASPIPGVGERNSIPYQSVFSTMLAQRIWNDYNFDGNQRVVQLSGIIDLPHDQAKYDENFGVQPYNFTQQMFDARRSDTEGFVRVSFENTERNNRLALGNDSGALEVVMGWRFRDLAELNTDFLGQFGTAGNIPPKTFKRKAISDALKWLTRATESSNAPVDRPLDLLYVGPGDDIVQMQVAGATMSDPFMLAISGDGIRPVNARVREFVSLKSTNHVVPDRFISEGAHAVLFLDFNGQIGLGSRAWNEHSTNAWNLLGKDYVTICPLGDGCVDVNANLLVTDRLALIAATTFGQDKVNRVTFYSQDPREIRIPAGGELDLSTFGQGNFRQEIAFGGQVRLVVEEGATIRFPETNDVSGGVVLYFNDEAQLVFEGPCDGSFLPFTDAAMVDNGGINNAPAENSRVRIVGNGQIWLNKDASMHVDGNVYVGVETDDLTQQTDVTISIQRQGAWFIGTDNLPGGAFQVGNHVDRNSEEIANHSISFSLILNGPDALFHTDREGFFGLGAGILNKGGTMNGNATAAGNPVLNGDGTAASFDRGDGVIVPVFNPAMDPTTGVWQVHRLYNVDFVTITNQQGIIEHRQMFDGATSDASLWAIGPASSYVWSQNGNDDATVRGGGNVMLVPDTAIPAAPIFVNVWDYAGPLANGEEYSMLPSGPLLLDRAIDLPFGTFGADGKTYSFAGFGAAEGMANLLFFAPFASQPNPKIDLAETKFATRGGFTNTGSLRYGGIADSALISRIPAPSVIQGLGTVEDAVEIGAFSATANAAGNPATFTVVQS